MDLKDALREALPREAEPAYLLDRRGHLVFVNDAWDRAARAAFASPSVGAEQMVGRSWLDGISGRARRYYAALLERAFALGSQEPPRALVHLTEANDARFARVVAHRFLPLHSPPDDEPGWVLVMHALVSQTDLQARYEPVDPCAGQLGTAGADHRTQCTSCRRTRAGDGVAGGGVWAMVPAWIAQVPEGTRYGLCRACRERYFIRPAEEAVLGARAARLPESARLWLSARTSSESLAS